jgi:hypothetical protein
MSKISPESSLIKRKMWAARSLSRRQALPSALKIFKRAGQRKVAEIFLRKPNPAPSLLAVCRAGSGALGVVSIGLLAIPRQDGPAAANCFERAELSRHAARQEKTPPLFFRLLALL